MSSLLVTLYELIKLVSNSKFTKNKTTIGFTGAPWTLLVYMLNKKSPKKELNKLIKDKNSNFKNLSIDGGKIKNLR